MKPPKGWRIRTLEEVAEIQTGLSKSSSRTGEFVRLPYLRVANVQDGHFDLSEVKEIDVPTDSVDRFRVRAGESRIEGSDGLTAQKITVKLYGRGVFAKQERMIGSTNTKYFIRRAGQLIYSKLDFLNGAFGIIPSELDGYESTLDLPSFDVKPSADVRWLLAYLVRPEFYEKQVGAAAGGRIARRVSPHEFLKLRLKVPDVTEQRAIAAVLDSADTELRLLRQQRTALDHQKRGLMQQLLTGKIRVPL